MDSIKPQREHGYSLVSTIVAVATLGVLVTLSFNSWVSTNQAAKLINSSDAFSDIDQAIAGQIGSKLSTVISCPKPADFSLDMDMGQLGKVDLTVSTDVIHSSHHSFLQTDPQAQAGYGRCKTQTIINKPWKLNQSALRFCYKITGSGSASMSTIAGGGAFVEVTLLLRDARNDQPISCNQFLSPNFAFGVVKAYTSLYWPVITNNQTLYRSSNSFQLISRGS